MTLLSSSAPNGRHAVGAETADDNGELSEYNPLDYRNLTRNIVQELMTRGPYTLPLQDRFPGAGVYALFYLGDFPPYRDIRSPDVSQPIYVGKAVPEGARKGQRSGARAAGRELHTRIGQHVGSIRDAENLRIEDFLCRFLVVTPLWIIMAERFLIEHYRPIWNVCLEGFGLHNPGSGRHQGEIAWWDALHPGRPWAARLRQTRTATQAEHRLARFLGSQEVAEQMTLWDIQALDELSKT